ncbi:UDP-N-acetylmuramoyl-L-alanyl-D-glutamate--2,6-diaminopimelate ligase [Litorivicinus lipolyticus]|uniref:UDP-N-acetylmuramoyl-L-alanyl-D-glutamate--2,6-diaminopimelate ligase n=1 Tax=Litorivicinus lipolyticus TaxID=418701 RepID=A0A5Q2Q8F0_9GAMM|nr:UDP-N-acetylmuramoyl-L-alanyl-D-glutamate--2,6-diaminopimelate ligase [Litorivicinus lipolyticus]QGG80949.1 UDP-N-acetylmuramoyl-L-alanyl-D-glutamate--2,6-diaminopimelate ligase [Litorivicinus lipolyticus]
MIRLRDLCGDYSGLDNPEITGLTLDSRAIAPGMLFCAVSGALSDGHDFIQAAIESGASAVICERACELSVPCVVDPQLRHSLSALAGRFYADPSHDLRLVGVTGTNGKSTLCDLLQQAHHALGHRSAAMGTLGVYGARDYGYSGNTTADPIQIQADLAALRTDAVTDVAMEVSSHGLAQGRAEALRFDVGVFTNLSRDHLDYHGDMDRYALAKQHLFVGLRPRHWVLNAQTPEAALLAPLADAATLYGDGGSVRAQHIQARPSGVAFELVTEADRGTVESQLLGDFNVDNLLACAAVLLAQGVAFATVCKTLAGLRPVRGRMQVISQSPLVLVDYAHTPDGLAAALRGARAHCHGQLWVVFGAGGDRDTGKRPLMGQAADQLADRIVLTSDNPRSEDPELIMDDIEAAIHRPVHRQTQRTLAIEWAIRQMAPQDTLLIAGKGHEREQIIGHQVMHHDDAEVARRALDGLDA